jgi:MOSC domain-containing protein
VATVARLSIAPVKGLALVHPDQVEVGVHGVVEDRLFVFVDEDGRRYSLIRDGRMALIKAAYLDGRLRLELPDGTLLEDEVNVDGDLTTDMYNRDLPVRLVEGPWNEPVSEFIGRPLRLTRAVEETRAVDRLRGPVSLVSRASLDELGRHAGVAEVDARRFRMLVGIDGVGPHEEDEWLGREVRIGGVLARFLGKVDRCAITTQNPATGEVDLDTLRTIKRYRGLRDGKRLDFGIYGTVVEPGRIRVGDPVEPV